MNSAHGEKTNHGNASGPPAYDSLNRLATAETLSDNQPWYQGDDNLSNCWGEQYTYDAWGNFSAITPVSSLYIGCTQESLSMSPTTKNQLQDTSNDYVYDSAGNLTQPGPIGGPYVYDAENHLTSAGGVTYTYDGDGNRVMKSNGTIYWYGANSASLMESDLNGNVQRWYYFFDGQRVGRQLITNEVGFYMTDHLGSVRYLGGSATGYSIDYYPFGSIILNSDTGDDRYQFTAKERDAESGLDYFGARFNSSSIGRFMSPDPIQHPRQSNWNMDTFLATPQRWNQYSYAINNPLLYVDRDGAEAGLCYGCGPGGRTLSPLEAGFPESKHPIRDTVLMGAGAVLALGAPAAAGAALVRFLPLLTAAGAALQGARDMASEAIEDLKGLTSSAVTNSRIGSALNALKEHATDMDLKGLIREGAGALKGQHFEELSDTVRSLKNLKDSLQGALANPNLADNTRAAYNQAVTAINGFVNQVQPLIDEARKMQQNH